MSGWLSRLNKEEFQGDRAFFLECYDGNSRFVHDRIGRGTIEIENCKLSVIGGIQPGKIEPLIRCAIRGTNDDGLLQRFQLAVYPDDFHKWKWIDRDPNFTAHAKYEECFVTLHELSFESTNSQPPSLSFTEKAQQFFIEWMEDIQSRARSDDICPAMESYILKLPKTIVSLALIFELIEGGREFIGEQSITRALQWSDYLISHAKRIYGIAIHQGLDGAKTILDRRNKLPDLFTARDVHRKGWSGLNDTESVMAALEWLTDYRHLNKFETPPSSKGGAPTIQYSWN